MTRAYSPAFRQKMVARLIGSDAVSALQLSRETGVRQQNLSRWLQEARSLPFMSSDPPAVRHWTVAQKARLLIEAAELKGEELAAYLEARGVTVAEFEQWRVALEGERASVLAARRIRRLERELARKDKALAEAAALLVLKKTIESLYQDAGEDGDTPAGSDR
jgi:transposase